ncbi:MAG: hypothetical protein ACOY90_05880 [Candidatus Zhuqueibacterota bacterium]
MYENIITHNDFDGVVSAALCSYIYRVNFIKFAGPDAIERSEITITRKDIVCDLPYPLECGLWFDHHEGNLGALKYRKIKPASIPGKFDVQPSCARVIYDYHHQTAVLPPHFEALVAATDQIDSFDYDSIESWRSETPAKIIDATIRLRTGTPLEKRGYLKQLTFLLRDEPLEKVAAMPEVAQRYQEYLNEESEMSNIIQQNSYFLTADSQHEIVILDLSQFNRPPYVIKNLAYLLYPEALAVLEVKNIFRHGLKTNDISFSLSLSLNLNRKENVRDVGEIMRELNIGDGHKGAAAGKIPSHSKQEMLKKKEHTLNEILALWKTQV